MPSNSSSEDLSALERLTRMFNMGEYGKNLAQEILDQYLAEVGYYDSDEMYEAYVEAYADLEDDPEW